jgi:hypothetical protein
MGRFTVSHVPRVYIDYTADQWELYDHPDSVVAAQALNRVFVELVDVGYGRDQVMMGMEVVMRLWAHVGALDSEPYRTLQYLLDKTFPVD